MMCFLVLERYHRKVGTGACYDQWVACSVHAYGSNICQVRLFYASVIKSPANTELIRDITDKSGDLTLCLICRGLRYAESPEAKIVHTNSWANFMSCLEIIPTHDDDAPSTPPNMLTISPDHDFGGRMKDGYKIVARILKGFGGDSISEAKMQALIRHLQENDITPFHASFNFNAKQIHILFGSCQFERPDSPRGLEILRRTKAYHKFRNAVLFSVPHWKLQFQSFRELDKESRGHAGIEEANKEVMIMSFAPLVTELAAPLLMPVPENGTMAKLALAWLEAGIIDPVEKMAVYNTSTVQDETSTAMTISRYKSSSTVVVIVDLSI